MKFIIRCFFLICLISIFTAKVNAEEVTPIVEKITINVGDPVSEASIQLLEGTDNFILLDTKSGSVSLRSSSDLNPEVHQSYEFDIQISLVDGTVINKPFIVEVNPNTPISRIEDVNSLSNVIPENISENGFLVGITAYAEEGGNVVNYYLVDNDGGRFAIDSNTGVVSVADFTLFNVYDGSKYSITVEAHSEYGYKQSKDFDIAVIHNYENDIPIVNHANLLLGWNESVGQNYQGWSWLDDIAYGNPGWLLLKEGPLGGGEQYSWGWGVRSYNKGDYGKKNTAFIDSNNKGPSTNTGGSLKVTETEDSTDHRSTWWLWYDGKPLSERNITNSTTDRMSFYLKTEGMNNLNDDGGKESIGTNFHIGTYLCWKTGLPAYGTGDGCPYEGEGNQHYYHYLSINPGAWIHVLLDQHPQHIRGGKSKLENNPSFISHQKNYFEQLSQFYFEIRYPHVNKTNFNVDELQYFSSKDMVEPEQNEESISSLWVGYWRNKGVWEIGFHDQSHDVYNDDNNSTFEIRWSIAPITNANFEQAELIQPMFYNGDKYVGQNAEQLIRRPNGWRSNVWTRFELPDEIERRYLKVFFAVKDVSVAGEHIGTNWPYNKGDGHDAPTSNIKIIDYYLRSPAN